MNRADEARAKGLPGDWSYYDLIAALDRLEEHLDQTLRGEMKEERRGRGQ